MTARVMIETRDLRQIYGMGDAQVAALDGVSIKIYEGEFVAILGPSGSGKTTLMNIHGCLSRPTSGEYFLDDEDVRGLDKVQLATIRNKKIGYVFQAYNLLARTTAIQNVILPLQYDRKTKRSAEERNAQALKVLEKVGLADRVEHEPQELSGGQQQRVAIARALVNDPVLIMADEPTGNLDSKSGEAIMELLHDLHKQGMTIVMVTHNPETAKYTQRTIHLIDGKLDKVIHNGKPPS